MTQKTEDVRSVEQLLDLVETDVRIKHVFFWGDKPKIPGVVDKSCFSNWFPATFCLKGHEYPTTEHYMMAEKARLFRDEMILEKILQAKSSGEAKALGRKIAGFDDEVWIEHRFEIVVTGNVAKFSQHDELREFLLRTGSKVLVEASPQDRIWGIGIGSTNKNVENPLAWNGLNLLGFALMEARKRLQNPGQ